MKPMLLAAALLSLTTAHVPALQPTPPAAQLTDGHRRVVPKACPKRVLLTNAVILDLILTGRADRGADGLRPA
jgi:hypothetical protein